jgi:methyltransferase
VIVLATAIVAVFLAIEARRAARNERSQRAAGGVEPDGDVYAALCVAYPAAFSAMLAEGAIRGVPAAAVVIAGAVLFAAAKALKWWAIVSLGSSWTFRVIVVRGAPRVNGGPYRFLRHPNYLAVIGELVGLGLMTGARVAGPFATLGFVALIARRIRIEDRALDALSPSAPTNV